MATIPKNRELASKEAATFKSILKFYEHKQYKKGLKGAEQILKKFPEHGETLAMKGLFCHHLDRKEEGHEFIKKGLRADLRSHICNHNLNIGWHVYGLVHRAEKNYEEASKCYAQALRCDKDNFQILRDFSMLQIQMRNYEAYNDSRHQLLNIRPRAKVNWFGLAISYHLLNEYEHAEKIISAFDEGNAEEEASPLAQYEESEKLLYQNMIIEESGSLKRALDHLETIKSKVLDKRSWNETKARISLQLNLFGQAETEYASLLSENPDSMDYIRGFLKSKQLEIEGEAVNSDSILTELRDLQKKYPKSQVISFLILKYSYGADFESNLDKYLIKSFQKGIPSLFKNISDLMRDRSKAAVIARKVESYKDNLVKYGKFEKSDVCKIEAPTTLLWVYYFLANLYDWRLEYDNAIRILDLAILHSPTVVELFMLKAKVFKHLKNPGKAMEMMNMARNLDLQDRYVNSKCTKYMLENDQLKPAEEAISLFTRSHASDPHADLTDMQCMWFHVAYGKSLKRQKLFGQALKKFHQVEKHFIDMYDDQFDFHAYALRKMTLRAYVKMLRAHDHIRVHKFYVEAAKSAIDIYLELFDRPENSGLEDLDTSNMTESEIKKALKKAKKAEEKRQAALEQAAKEHAANNPKNKLDEDPLGKKLIEGVDYLHEAAKFLKPLLAFNPQAIDNWIYGCEIYFRKKKPLLLLKCIKRAMEISPSDYRIHFFKIAYCVEVENLKDDIPKVIREILTENLINFTQGKTLKELNTKYAQANPEACHQLASARVLAFLTNKNEESTNLLQNLTPETPKIAIEIHRQLKLWKRFEAAKKFSEKSNQLFPLCSHFSQ